MKTDFVLDCPLSGVCKIDVDKICMQDWLPKIDKSGSKLCRDAFICHYAPSNEYRLMFVSGYTQQLKITISESDAKNIIDKMGLTFRSRFLPSSKTYRITWFHIDYLDRIYERHTK
jgi:hypothetical protein